MAGSWTYQTAARGAIEGSLNLPAKISKTMTADAADASVPDGTWQNIGGNIQALAVQFDGTTTPDSLTITVKADGITLFSDTLTASGRIYPDQLEPVAGDVVVSVSGNTVNSAVAIFDFYVV